MPPPQTVLGVGAFVLTTGQVPVLPLLELGKLGTGSTTSEVDIPKPAR